MSTSNANRMPPYKLWASTDDGKLNLYLLTSDHIEGALLVVLRESFFPEENICKGVDVMSEKGAADEQPNTNTAEATGKIAIRNIQRKLQVQIVPKAMIDFMIYVDSKVDLFKLYGTLCVFSKWFSFARPTPTASEESPSFSNISTENRRHSSYFTPCRQKIELTTHFSKSFFTSRASLSILARYFIGKILL
ncbi:uncharacterized protein LOC126843268 [Adelges cooleyi]|uniref:uncharacterized protein LOC126843268 n=1 Tax=Adelges cooleyi TaxID=133065 RepID=UPI00217FD066|nr:uncharacterized protein LOC126843268 [Adelges cooleyi]